MKKKIKIENERGEVVGELTTHARLAPSAFKGYEVCPSYVPDQNVTKASERGTELHGKLQEHEDDAHLFVDEEADAHQLALIGEYIAPFLKDAKKLGGKVLKEHTFNLRGLKVEGCTQGTGDLLILWMKSRMGIDLFDYKMGWWEVEDAEQNIQLWIYVLGCLIENKWAKWVRVHILQPARDEISVAEFERSDVERLLLRARTIADRVNERAGIEFNPQIDTCLWCANKANCLALHEMALNISHQADLKLPNVDLRLEDFNSLTEAGDVYDAADIVAKWAQAIKWKITQFAVDGNDVPGHNLVETDGKRIIVDPEGAYEVLRDKYSVELSEFLAASNPSITKLLKAAGSKAEHGQMGKTQAAASSDLMDAGVVTSTQPSAYLVRVKPKKEKQD